MPGGFPKPRGWEAEPGPGKDAPARGARRPGRESVVSRAGLRAALCPAAGVLGPAAGRRPTLAGNVSPGDAAPGGERGAAAATVRPSAVRERTCGAAGGGDGAEPGAAGGRREAGRWRRRGSRSRARRSTKSGAALLRYPAGPGPRRAGRPGSAVRGRPGKGEGPRPERGG